MDTHRKVAKRVKAAILEEFAEAATDAPLQPAAYTLSDPELAARVSRTAQDPDFLFTRASIDLSKQLMAETTVSLNEVKRRAQQADIEAKQLKLENDRRVAKGEKPLAELAKEDEDALPVEDKGKPEDDAYLSESGHILIDYLSLNPSLAIH